MERGGKAREGEGRGVRQCGTPNKGACTVNRSVCVDPSGNMHRTEWKEAVLHQAANCPALPNHLITKSASP